MTDKKQAALEALVELYNFALISPLMDTEQADKYYDTIREALTEDSWRPIETAPKDGSVFLALYTNNLTLEYKAVCYCPDDEMYPWADLNDLNSAYPDGRLKYWMPLPARPEKG